ncbi:MAG: hypothetical protein AB7T06_10830 [Kofleriaceae bacterium]
MTSGVGDQWCAYPDSTCSSGLRYAGKDVGGGLSGECVEGPGDDAGVDDAPPDIDAPIDAPIDSNLNRCNTGAAFQAPTLVATVNSALGVYSISMNSDETIAVFTGSDNGSEYVARIATRASAMDNFSTPTSGGNMAAITGGTGIESYPTISPDGLAVYFGRYNTSTFTNTIYVAERASVTEAFPAGSIVQVDNLNLNDAVAPFLSSNGQTLYWRDEVDSRLRSAAKGGTNSAFFVKRVESSMNVGASFALSADELTLYYGGTDVSVSTRASKQDQFGPGTALTPVNSAQNDSATFVTSDNCILYLATQRAGGLGGYNIWAARRPL